jgi:hypothetical protein
MNVASHQGNLMKPELTATPRLAPGVRLNDKNQLPRQLLLANASMRISGPSLEIVRLCDGEHTIQQIADELHILYSKAEPQRITDDLLGYLELLKSQGAVEF